MNGKASARARSALSISPRRSERTATYSPIAAASTASATETLATAAMRERSVIAGGPVSMACSRLSQRVAHAPDRVDQIPRSRFLELSAQVAHIHAQRVRAGAEVIAPHPVIDQAVREHLPGGERQLYEALPHLRPVARWVQAQLRECQGALLRLRVGPAQQRPQPRQPGGG